MTCDLEGTGQVALEEAEVRQRGKDFDFGRILAEDFDGADAVGVENVVDVVGEVVSDGGGGDGDAGGPLFDELFDVEKAMIARGFQVFGKLSRGEIRWAEGLRTDSPDRGYPGEIGAG